MGLVHIYCGDGKGKTTAAVGLAVRFAGAGGKVLFYQFMKDGTSGERAVLQTIPGIDVVSGYCIPKFSFQMSEAEKSAAAAAYQKEFFKIEQLLLKNAYGMVVLDEIMSCVSVGFLPTETVTAFLRNRPSQTEIVMTGRNPATEIAALADYISEIRCVQHPFQKHIAARKGIEF